MVGNTRANSKGLPSQELLDDLCSRFLLNVPKEDLESFERILFLMEQAHWFYEDNSVEQNPSLRSLSFKEFTVLMFNNCAQLRPYIRYLDDIHREFTDYKFSIPVSGAIILDDTNERCLLVKGWKAGSCWSFPRGKRGKDEEDDHVAIREVEEETGFDLRGLLKVGDHLETHLGTQRLRLFIIPSVRANTAFAPQTKKEISEIAWHRLDELVPACDEMITRSVNGLKLYMVAPFLKPLQTWLSTEPALIARKSDPPVKGTTVWKAKPGIGDGAESSTSKVPEQKVVDNRPGKTFRNFHFDYAEIVKAAESAFSAC
ncbi:mRNA-decapping enzyme subunit 2 [Carex littledalei]|uniref:mRNA-decapping enzyme subunit 2 n=1 Tax=Carex littledalei TaxID=544730 RepID=A0A833QSF4_9POAL|nr:mRNA-decapping enzyme subunit 2 [Carex littledalei]